MMTKKELRDDVLVAVDAMLYWTIKKEFLKKGCSDEKLANREKELSEKVAKAIGSFGKEEVSGWLKDGIVRGLGWVCDCQTKEFRQRYKKWIESKHGFPNIMHLVDEDDCEDYLQKIIDSSWKFL